MTKAAPTRIICIGNRLIETDSIGPQVYDYLVQNPPPPGVEGPGVEGPGVEVIDGGVGGLALLPLVEGCRRVIFVDAVAGFAPQGKAVILSPDNLRESTADASYGHGGGLGYFLSILPAVIRGPLPEIIVVGVEQPLGTVSPSSIRDAVTLCLTALPHDSASRTADAGTAT